MAYLEEMGLILQPYTSAGRIPSDLGYRYYVDQLMQEKEAEEEKKEALLQRVDRMETMLEQVASVLASNTNYATMVTAPQYKNSSVKFVQLSQVDEESILAVIVIEGNVVKNHLIRVPEPLMNDEILKMNVLLNSFLQGLSLRDINLELIETMKVQAGIHSDILDCVLEGVTDAIKEADELEIYTSGTTNIFKYPELGNPETATRLLDTLVEKKSLTKLVDEAQEDEHTGIQVYIGNEMKMQNMEDCSLVTATYELDGGGMGTIGIIGPKRMNYQKVVKTLKNLTGELDEIFNKK
jgi:heat-inducible transcriptional repressor